MKADFTDFLRLNEFLQALSDGAINNQAQAVMNGALAYEADVKRAAPVDTGDYRARIRSDPGGTILGSPIVLIGSPHPQVRQLEFGGTISAKNGEYLTFKTKDGQWHRVKEVFQPAKPHWRPAWDLNNLHYADIMYATLMKDVVMK